MQIIFPILIYSLVCILVNYSVDRPSLPYNSKELSMPSIRDLPDDSSLYEIDEYVSQEIIPAHDYFMKLKAAELPNDNILLSLILYGLSSLYVFRSVFIILSEIGFFYYNRFFCVLSAIGISLAICFLLGWVFRKIYKKWFAIDEFALSSDQVIDTIYTHYEGMKISEERYIQNYLIHIYHDYIKSKQNKTERRCFAYKLLTIVAGIISFLFFFNPDRYT